MVTSCDLIKLELKFPDLTRARISACLWVCQVPFEADFLIWENSLWLMFFPMYNKYELDSYYIQMKNFKLITKL